MFRIVWHCVCAAVTGLGVMLLILSLFFGTFLWWTPGCENVIRETVYSPDGNYKVILYSRDCGATTGFGTNISLAKRDEDINTGFRIFTADDDHGQAKLHPVHPELIDIRARWIDNHSLELSYDKNARLFRERDMVGGIKIIHHKR